MPPGNADPQHRDAPRAYPLRVAAWGEIPGLVHGFLGRAHGLAPGPFRETDLRDRLRAAGETPTAVHAARQVHGAAVVACEGGGEPSDEPRRLPEADALVSAARVVLTIRTADCVPILLVAPAARAVAAVHAGWKGILAGVIENAVAALGKRYGAAPSAVLAAAGPAIGGCCYEFGAEHCARFTARLGAEAAHAWRPDERRGGERVRLDLRVLARIALERAGVRADAIATIGPCTAEHPRELHSYRRDGENAGRQLSYIGWRGGT
jgi:YfiH family protein